jgi:Flp pilus assembly pilin Flp
MAQAQILSIASGLWRNSGKDCGMQTLKVLWEDEEGQDMTEYALLLVLIALISLASLNSAGQAVSDVFSNAAKNLTTT